MIKIRFQKGKPAELLILKDDVEGWEKAGLWRWNENGLGYSDNGLDGPFQIAITMDGQINADRVTTGYLSANRISGGVLQSTNKTNDIPNLIFDLDGGTLTVPGLRVISPNESTITFDGNASKSISFQSQDRDAVFIHFKSGPGRHNNINFARIGMYADPNLNSENALYIEPGTFDRPGESGKVIFRGVNSSTSGNADANVEIYGTLKIDSGNQGKKALDIIGTVTVNGVNVTNAIQTLVEIQAQQMNLTSEQQAKLSAITEELEQAERKRSQQEYPES